MRSIDSWPSLDERTNTMADRVVSSDGRSKKLQKWAGEFADRQHRHDLRRGTILQAAAQWFNKKGYHGTTIGDIARYLNVSKAAIYYYVKSKEELLFQCHQASLDIGMEGLRKVEELRGEPREKLQAALHYFIEHMIDRVEGCAVMFEEGVLIPRHHHLIVRRRDMYERKLRELVEEGIESGDFEACDPCMVVFAILGAMNWIPKWYSPKGRASPDKIAETFSTYLVRGLQRTKAGTAAHDEGGKDPAKELVTTTPQGGGHV